MSIKLLLTHNSRNINLVDYFIYSNGDYDRVTTDENVNYKSSLILNKENDVEICKGINKINNTEYMKTEIMNYSSGLITDETFINNLNYFLTSYKLSVKPTHIEIEGTKYYTDTRIIINGRAFYVLYDPPSETPTETTTETPAETTTETSTETTTETTTETSTETTTETPAETTTETPAETTTETTTETPAETTTETPAETTTETTTETSE
jgi:hypothetical protein